MNKLFELFVRYINKKSGVWRGVMTALSAVIVFATTYALILPAITLDSGVELSPNVQIYDHDHDFRADGGIKAGKYKTTPVSIGKNVWIGANSVILRGSTIGENAVVGAGSVVKGMIQENSVFVQKRGKND